MKHRYQFLRGLDVSSSPSNVKFTRIGRRFHSPSAKGAALFGEQWRIMTNTITNTYVVIFLSVSIFGRGYHSRYKKYRVHWFEHTQQRA